jgi:hypothetical protein
MNEQHLMQLTEQVRNMDMEEQAAVAQGLSSIVMLNALAALFSKQENALSTIQAALEG